MPFVKINSVLYLNTLTNRVWNCSACLIAVKSRQIITSQNANQGPFLPPYSCANRKCWEMQRSEDIHWEFQPSSFVVLSCCILLHVCVLVGTQGCFMKVSLIITHFCAHMSTVWKCHHEIWQQGSFMSNNVVKDNGNKEAHSLTW